MTLVRWQPTRQITPVEGLSMLQRRMNRLFDETFNEETDEHHLTWSPRVELTELDDRFEVTVELPGLTREDVKVELQENTLTISGEKLNSTENKNRNLYISERTYGQFRRNFQFPNRVDATKIDAIFKDGVLIVSLPKVEDAKPKQIDIKIH